MVDCLIKGRVNLDCIYVDAMLGWLARILRILFGLNVVYNSDLDDRELMATGCLVVTRDEALFNSRRGPTMLLTTDDHVKWLSIFLQLGAKPYEKTRCPKCGGVLAEISCREAEQRVGHSISSTRCWRCNNCGHIYWQGSHWRSLRQYIEKATTARAHCIHLGI